MCRELRLWSCMVGAGGLHSLGEWPHVLGIGSIVFGAGDMPGLLSAWGCSKSALESPASTRTKIPCALEDFAEPVNATFAGTRNRPPAKPSGRDGRGRSGFGLDILLTTSEIRDRRA